MHICCVKSSVLICVLLTVVVKRPMASELQAERVFGPESSNNDA